MKSAKKLPIVLLLVILIGFFAFLSLRSSKQDGIFDSHPERMDSQ